MDALPIEEQTNLAYASKTPGLMHACGHDGHTAMLLGAARYLAETRNFAGDAVVIFQPAEEGGAGAAAMIKDGLMDRFAIDQVYGMHNGPGIPGRFIRDPAGPDHGRDRLHRFPHRRAGRPRGASAHLHRSGSGRRATDHRAAIGRGAQRRSAGTPQSSRCANSYAGNARNVIPQTVELRGTVRTLKPHVRKLVEKRVHEVAAGIALSTGTKIDVTYERGYPVTVNHASQTDIASGVAKEIAGDANVHDTPPMMGAEDFAYMLEARPGAFIFCGNGDSAGLHHPAYNFNDDAIVYGTSYWIKLVENTLAA